MLLLFPFGISHSMIVLWPSQTFWKWSCIPGFVLNSSHWHVLKVKEVVGSGCHCHWKSVHCYHSSACYARMWYTRDRLTAEKAVHQFSQGIYAIAWKSVSCTHMEMSFLEKLSIFMWVPDYSACKHMDSQHAITWTNSCNGMTHGVMQVNRCPDCSVSDKGPSLRLKLPWCFNPNCQMLTVRITPPSQALFEKHCHTHSWLQQRHGLGMKSHPWLSCQIGLTGSGSQRACHRCLKCSFFYGHQILNGTSRAPKALQPPERLLSCKCFMLAIAAHWKIFSINKNRILKVRRNCKYFKNS